MSKHYPVTLNTEDTTYKTEKTRKQEAGSTCSSLVPRPLTHSGCVGGAENEAKLHSWWIYKASR